MIRLNAFRSTLFLTVTFLLCSVLLWAAEGIISKIPDPSGQYCHLRFPAIREDTFSWPRPVLKDPSEGDIIDFYGPCDHDPLGKDEILRQRAEYYRQFSRPGD
jgi:hypothetical protein